MLFLTGGTGLVGLHILDALLAHRIPVRAMVRTAAAGEALRSRGAEVVVGRVEDPAVWQALADCSGVVHAAALVYGSTDWAAYQRVNVDATRLAAARARQLDVPLVHISSVAVYGPRGRAAPGTVGEDAPIGSSAAGAMYPRSKRLAEAAVWEERDRGLRALALRPCVVYGEGDRLFLPNLIRRARRGWFPLIGGGRATLPLVYAGNVAQAVVAALAAREGWGKAYNVTNDDEITGSELVRYLAQGMGRPLRGVGIPRLLAMGLAGVAELGAGFTGSPLPGLQSAVRFLADGNPYTSRAARETLGWHPSARHAVAFPRSVISVTTSSAA